MYSDYNYWYQNYKNNTSNNIQITKDIGLDLGLLEIPVCKKDILRKISKLDIKQN